MAFNRFRFKPVKISRFLTTYRYEIPERYRDAFYLANAAFYDQVNWFLHRAYEVCFPKLVHRLQDREKNLGEKEAVRRVLTVIDCLQQCNSIIDVRFPLTLDSGRKEVVRGFRAQHGLHSGFGACLGGLRIREDITRDHMKALSVIATYKHACMGIRMAGAHGGLKVDGARYSEAELERMVRQYGLELRAKGYCDGSSDVIEPDLNTCSREMAWIASSFPDVSEKWMATGKPCEMGGIENYFKAASQGAFFAIDHFLNNDKVLEKINVKDAGIKNKTFIIQGLGKLGSALAKYLQHSGAICVGVKEHDGYLYDSQGINVESVIEYKNKHGSIQNFGKVKPLVNDDIYKEPCDLLVLAAQQKSFICFVADKVKAKMIVEAANGSITQTSHRIFVSRSKLVLPDIYVSSGHSVASYLEYLLHLKRIGGTRVHPVRRLYDKVLESFDEASQQQQQRKCQLVSSAVTQKIVTCEMQLDSLAYAIDHVMAETGNELLEIAKEYDLDLDIRTAGYIKAIQTIHDLMYELKRC